MKIVVSLNQETELEVGNIQTSKDSVSQEKECLSWLCRCVPWLSCQQWGEEMVSGRTGCYWLNDSAWVEKGKGKMMEGGGRVEGTLEPSDTSLSQLIWANCFLSASIYLSLLSYPYLSPSLTLSLAFSSLSHALSPLSLSPSVSHFSPVDPTLSVRWVCCDKT